MIYELSVFNCGKLLSCRLFVKKKQQNDVVLNFGNKLRFPNLNKVTDHVPTMTWLLSKQRKGRIGVIHVNLEIMIALQIWRANLLFGSDHCERNLFKAR